MSRKAVQSTLQDEQKKTEISEFLNDLRELGIGDPKSPTDTSLQSIPPQSSSPVPSYDQSDSHSTLSPVQQRLSWEWVPLELSFGIPLFSQEANRAVCDKVCVVVTWATTVYNVFVHMHSLLIAIIICIHV